MSRTKDRIVFSPSPPVVKPLNLADIASPPRARRHQRRRDAKSRPSHPAGSDDTELRSAKIAYVSSASRPLTSPRVPLSDKDVNAALISRGVDRDGAAPDKPAPRSPRKDLGPTLEVIASDPTYDNLDTERGSAAFAYPTTEMPMNGQSKARSIRASIQRAAPLARDDGKKAVASVTPQKSSSTETTLEVVIKTPKKTAAISEKPNQVKSTSESVVRKKEEEGVDTPTQQTKKPVGVSKTGNRAKKVSVSRTVATSVPKGKPGLNAGSNKKPATSPVRKSSRSTLTKRGMTSKVASESNELPQISGQAADELGDNGKQSRAAIDEDKAPEEAPLFFDTAIDDRHDSPDAIPPSSPNRFLDWHKNAPPISEDDLEYVSHERRPPHQREERSDSRVSQGRLGAGMVLPLVNKASESSKDRTTLREPAAPAPMHSTPLKHKDKTKEQSQPLPPPANSPATAERMAREQERFFGIGSDDEDDEALLVISVNKRSEDKTTSQTAIKSEDLEEKPVTKQEKGDSSKKIGKPPAQKKPRLEPSSTARVDEKDAERLSAVDMQGMVKEATSATTTYPVLDTTSKAAALTYEEDDSSDDLFGSIAADRRVLELTQKARSKKSGQIHPIKEGKKDSQTLNDSHLSIAFDFNEAASPLVPVMEDRDESPGVIDFGLPPVPTQKEAVPNSTTQAGPFSSELSQLDSDLEDDIREKVVKQQKRGKSKAGQSEVGTEAELVPLSIAEIQAMANGEEVGQNKGSNMTAKVAKKPATKRKLQLDEEDENKKKASAPKKKALKLTQDEAAVAPKRTPGGAAKKGAKVTKAPIELDDFDVPPGMTSADVVKSKTGKKVKGQANPSIHQQQDDKVTAPKVKPKPKPKPRAAKAPLGGDIWDEPPAAGLISAGTKKVAMGKQAIDSPLHSQNEPVITSSTRKKLKRPRLSEESEDEEAESLKNARQRKETITYFDSLKDFELAVEEA